MDPMYSREWFETFAATVPDSINEADVRGIASIVPPDQYPRLLDVGCGSGRIAGPLSARGYAVTGIDISLDALRLAQRSAPGPRYVALDQRHIGSMKWQFDAALFLWNSLGFVGERADVETLIGVVAALRPGGKVLLDLYNPEWLERNQQSRQPDRGGPVSVRRWVRGGRCFHEIRYAGGRVDDIQFNIYTPDAMRALAHQAGLVPVVDMVWWNAEVRPDAQFPRYQLLCTRSS